MISSALQDQIDQLMDSYPERRSALLPALHLLQKEIGYISPEAIDFLADRFGIAATQVYETVSFYHMFHTQPVGKHVIHVCTNISCMLRGSDDIMATLKETLGIEVGETTPDGLFTLLEVECLAACGGAPVVQLNDEYIENADSRQLQKLIARLKQDGDESRS